MKQTFYSLVMALLLAACMGNPSVTACHQAAEALLSTDPDSACALLAAGRDEAERHGNRRQQMYHRLLTAEAMNKSQRELKPDTALHEMLHYFDHHGTANLRLRACYVMGCAYRNANEAPAALHYYTLAAEKADTTRSDCDYATLFRVYGQMALIYGQQNLPGDQLHAFEKYCHYALLAKDTINYIGGIDHMSDAYYILGDSVRMLEMTEKARNLYLERGFTQYAAQVYPTAIHVALENKNYAQARKYMDIFEQESGIFDEEGNIEAGREHYYNYQGKYFFGIGKLDSAENYYRKLLPYERYHHLAYEGLLYIYLAKHNTDSIAKYVPLFDEGVRYWVGNQQSAAIVQSSALYDYTRNEQLAERKSEEASHAQIFVLCLAMLIIVILFILYIGYRHYVQQLRNKEQTYRRLEEKYTQMMNEHQQLTAEYDILYSLSTPPTEMQQLLAHKQHQIEELETAINQYKENVQTMPYAERMALLQHNEVITKIRKKLLPKPSGKEPKEDLWPVLSEVYRQYMPLAWAHLNSVHLSQQVYTTCILVHLGFSTSDIANLLDTTSQRISNVKRSACQKLFNCNDSTALFQLLKKMEAGKHA